MKTSSEEVTLSLLEEMMSLGRAHSVEIGEGEPVPNMEGMVTMADFNMLGIVTTRDDDQKLIGYLILMIGPDFLYQHKTIANEAGFYVKPERRGLKVANQLVKGAELLALKMGAGQMSLHTTMFNDVGKVFERFGYDLSEKKYIKKFWGASCQHH